MMRSVPGLAEAQAVAPGLSERAAAHDREGRFPAADLEALREAGLLGLMVPERLGGLGASFADYAEVAMAIGAASGATALVFNMHASITGAMARTPDGLLKALGAPETALSRRDEALAAASKGSLYSVAMSERGSGARLSALSTTYWPENGGFRIRGTKSFVSGAAFADTFLVAARADSGSDARGPDESGTSSPLPPRVSYFLVPADKGCRVEQSWDSLGMRATGSDDVHIDASVDSGALLGGIEGLALPLAQLMPQWLVASYAAVYVGVAQAALDAAVAHCSGRLGALPAVRARIGRADAAVAAARLVVLEAARAVDAAPGAAATNRWVWRAKLVAGETAAEVASSLLEAAGSSAMRRGHPLERLYRDARCGSLQPATSDVCADWLGLAALGRDPALDAAEPRW
ncbi:MAG: Acyl-CoA dehydrogenase type 2 domain [Acidimicrobiaceae bacterium]|nr:Acyl-CoA dehydrogenase type 2 domain [Acidimicrobiaceae bacterium]